MAWRDHSEAIALVHPMYHEHPSEASAYEVPDQYYFGSELVAAPFVAPADPDTRVSRQVVWLPPGEWTNMFTGERYEAGWHTVYGGIDAIPVFARHGAIVPLGPRSGTNDTENPDALEVHIFQGAEGRFDLYEDDGGQNHSITEIRQRAEDARMHIQIGAAQGETAHLPASRSYTIVLRGAGKSATATFAVDGALRTCDTEYDARIDALTLSPIAVAPTEEITITVRDFGSDPEPRDRRVATLRALLQSFRMDTNVKLEIYRRAAEIEADPAVLTGYDSSLTTSQLQALKEVLTGPTEHER
jgi:hypothetical protein